ncbi:MAG: hypothetical protein AB2L09_04495 [Coriobacteriia bacterium]
MAGLTDNLGSVSAFADVEGYQTEGTLYIVETLDGLKALVSLGFDDYGMLLARGMMDKEVGLTLRKAVFGREYSQGAPQYRTRAKLYTMKMGDGGSKPQISVEGNSVAEFQARGFRDNERVELLIERLPYDIPCDGGYQALELKLDF